MKKLVLQVDIFIPDNEIKTGMKRYKPVRDLYKLSEFQARKYAKKWGADYLKITDSNFLPDKHPVFQRLKMYELIEYDQILYLDMDAVILDICPNPFTLFEGVIFSAVRDRDWDKNKEKTQIHKAKINKLYGAKPDYRSFCSGVMLISKEFLLQTKDEWRKYLYSYDKSGEKDQGIFNKLIIECYDGKYNELGEEWGSWYRYGKYIDHLGGPFRKPKFNLIDYTEKFKIVDYIKEDLLSENEKT